MNTCGTNLPAHVQVYMWHSEKKLDTIVGDCSTVLSTELLVDRATAPGSLPVHSTHVFTAYMPPSFQLHTVCTLSLHQTLQCVFPVDVRACSTFSNTREGSLQAH